MDQEKFDIALKVFVEGCQNIHTDYMADHFNNLSPDMISVKRGKKYAKIIRTRNDGGSQSVHCFVDMTNGDVLMAASWKAPAKHARGNIFDGYDGLRNMDWHGAKYLR